MRTNLLIAALLASAAPVAAQPRAQNHCEVRFVRAPDDVRHVIETWLAAEPRCTSTIALRVIPTDDGYYLIAERPDGRIHERLVPDAQSAGVLVASWVADDWTAPRSDVAPVAAELLQPSYATPAETVTKTAITPSQRPSRGATPRWVSLGALFSTSDTDDGGLRLEVDLISRGKLTLGGSFAWSETSMMVGSAYGYGDMRSTDLAATIYGAYTLRSDRWELRGALGLGGVYSEVAGDFLASYSPSQPWTMESFLGDGGGLIGTASVILTRRLGDSWGINAGLVGHMISEQFPTTMQSDIQRKDAHLFLFTGLRYRL